MLGAHAQSADPEYGVQIFTENDLYSRRHTDQWYTNGLRIVFLPRDQDKQLKDFSAFARRFYGPEAVARIGFTFGQDIYTPKNIRDPNPQPWDRPWAGWTYFGAIAQAAVADKQDTVELDIGAVGPRSGAAWVQHRWHQLIGAPEPMGWNNQIGNELGVNLTWRRHQRLQFVCNTLDVIPHYGGAAGNVFTYVALGASVRAGQNISGFGDDRSTTSLRRGSSESTRFCVPPARQELEWYVFARAEGRLVGRNIFLDGNLLHDGPRVTKRPFVYDFALGASMRFAGNFRITFTEVWRAMEFKPVDTRTPLGIQKFGSIVLAYEF